MDTNSEYKLAKTPVTSQKVLKAMIAAQEFINSEPTQAAALLSEFLKMDLPIVNESIKDFTFNVRMSDFSIQLLDEDFRLIQKFENDFADAWKPDFKQYFYPAPLREVAMNRVEAQF